MARTLPLLDAAQRRAFDSPPKFTTPQRSFFFSLPEWAAPVLRAMSAAHMRGGFRGLTRVGTENPAKEN